MAHGSTEPSRQDDSMVEDMLAANGGGGGWVAEELVPMYKSFKSPPPHDWDLDNNNNSPMSHSSLSSFATPLPEGEMQAIHQRISDSLDSNSGHSSTMAGSVGTFDSDTMEVVDSFDGKADKIFVVDHLIVDDPSMDEKPAPAPPTTRLSVQTLSTAPSTNFGSIVSDASWQHNHNTPNRLYSMPTEATTTTTAQDDVDLHNMLQDVLENGNVSDSSLMSGDSLPSFEVESLKEDQDLMNDNDDKENETEMDGTLYLPAAAAAAATRDSSSSLSSFHRVARLPAFAAAAASPPSRDPHNDSKMVSKIPPLSVGRPYSFQGTSIALSQSRYHSNQQEQQQQPSLPSSFTTTATRRSSENRHDNDRAEASRLKVASSLPSATSTQATVGVHNHYMLCRRNQAQTAAGGSHAMLATSDAFPARKPSRRRLGTQDVAATDVPAVPARPSLPPPAPPPPTTTRNKTALDYKRLLAMGVGQPVCFDYGVDRVLRYGRGRRAYTPQLKDLMDECQRRYVAMGMHRHRGDLKPNTGWGKDQLRAWLCRHPLTDPAEVSRVRHEIELFKADVTAEISWNAR